MHSNRDKSAVVQDDFSDNSSFINLPPTFNNNANANMNEGRISDLEKEKEFLLQKIILLEKSNLDLMAYKKHVETTIAQINKEPNEQKKLQMLTLNLIRRKSLLRLERDLSPLKTPTAGP